MLSTMLLPIVAVAVSAQFGDNDPLCDPSMYCGQRCYLHSTDPFATGFCSLQKEWFQGQWYPKCLAWQTSCGYTGGRSDSDADGAERSEEADIALARAMQPQRSNDDAPLCGQGMGCNDRCFLHYSDPRPTGYCSNDYEWFQGQKLRVCKRRADSGCSNGGGDDGSPLCDISMGCNANCFLKATDPTPTGYCSQKKVMWQGQLYRKCKKNWSTCGWGREEIEASPLNVAGYIGAAAGLSVVLAGGVWYFKVRGEKSYEQVEEAAPML